jgi:PAS domain S-box-containing protein
MADKKRIFIVEDEAIIAMDLQGRLAAMGYGVAGLADSAVGLLELIRRAAPDAVLMDIVLSDDTDGISAAGEIIRELDIPVIYLTAHSDRETLERARASGPYGYVLKPFNDRILQSTIEIALAKHAFQAELRASARRFRRLVEHLPHPVMIIAADGRLDYVNPAFLNTFGFTRSELPDLASWFRLAVPEDGARRSITAAWRRALAQEPPSGEVPPLLRLRCRDGSARKVRVSAVPGGEDGAYVTLEDETKRLAIQSALMESERRFRELADNLPQIVFELDETGTFTFLNGFGLKSYGYPSNAYIARRINIFDLVHPDYREQALSDMHNILAGGEPRGTEYLALRQDGSPFAAKVYAHAILREGQSVGVRGIVIDISDFKRIEAALRESEERYKTLFDHCPEGIAVADMAEGSIRYANPAMCRLFGYEPDEMASLGALDLHPEWSPDNGRKRFAGALQGQGDTFTDVPCRRKGGPVFFADVSTAHMVIDGRACNVGFFKDVTGRRAAEEALRQAHDELEAKVAARTQELQAANEKLLAMDQMKSSFISLASHELRTPLTSVYGFAKLIARDFSRYYLPLSDGDGELTAKGRRIIENLSIVELEIERLTRLLNDILDLTKIESGRLEWRDTRVSPRRQVERAVLAVSALFAAKPQVRLELDIAPDLPDIVIDPDRLVQVLINLLNNAAKFTAQGLVRLSADCSESGWLRVRVTDTGIGIPPGEIERIFEKFHQVHTGDTMFSTSQGTGLGLAISRQIVEHYGGLIWADSEPGRGSAFTCTLPPAVNAGRREPAAGDATDAKRN